MDILLLLIPLSLVLVGVIAWFMLWAAKSGQFDDLEGPAHSVIMDDDNPPKPDDTPEGLKPPSPMLMNVSIPHFTQPHERTHPLVFRRPDVFVVLGFFAGDRNPARRIPRAHENRAGAGRPAAGRNRADDGSGARRILHHWHQVHQRTGQPFRSRRPAARLRLRHRTRQPRGGDGGRHRPTLIFPLFKAIQHAFYAEGRDVTQPGVLADLATELGVGKQAFLPRSTATPPARTQAHFRQARQAGVRGFPGADPATGRPADIRSAAAASRWKPCARHSKLPRRMMQRAPSPSVARHSGCCRSCSRRSRCRAMIDAHAHYSAPDAAAFPADAMLARLDAAGVRRLVVTSSPPHLAQRLYRHAPERVIPLLGVYDSDRNKANWVHDADLPARVAAQLQDGAWAGIGELHLFAATRMQPVFAQLVRLAARASWC
jgi:cbb3-type cytochrome oxidase maturation protein